MVMVIKADEKGEMIDSLEKKILVLENTHHIVFRHEKSSKKTIQNITTFLTSFSAVFEAEMNEDGVLLHLKRSEVRVRG